MQADPGLKALRLRPLAESDLEEIWLRIVDDDPGAADAMIDRFTEIFELIRRQPGMGAPTPALGPRAEGMLRRFPVGNYVIFYTEAVDTLVVERVLHGARDIEALFE